MTVTTVIVTTVQRPRRCDPEAHLVVAHHRGGTWIFSLEPSDNPSDIEGRRSDLCEVVMQLLCRLLTHLAAFRVSWKTVKQLRRDEKELEFEVLQGEGKRRRNTRFRALQFVGALMRRCSRQTRKGGPSWRYIMSQFN